MARERGVGRAGLEHDCKREFRVSYSNPPDHHPVIHHIHHRAGDLRTVRSPTVSRQSCRQIHFHDKSSVSWQTELAGVMVSRQFLRRATSGTPAAASQDFTT